MQPRPEGHSNIGCEPDDLHGWLGIQNQICIYLIDTHIIVLLVQVMFD